MADRGWRIAGIAVAGAFLLAVALFPLGELVATVRGVESFPAAFRGAGAGRAVMNTLWTAALVTPLVVAGATAAAYVTERSAARGRGILRIAVALSLLVPSFVTAQSWAAAYGPGGLLDDLVGISQPGTYGAAGVVIVLVVSILPLAYLVIAAALRTGADPDLERAARMAGADAWTAFRTVTLPLLRPAWVAAGALSFVLAVNAFGVPAILGLPAGFVTMTTRIYRDLNFAADPAAFDRVVVLATSLVALAVVTVAAADAAGATRAQRSGAARGRRNAPTQERSWLPGIGLGFWVLATTGLPMLALALRAITRGVGLPPTPPNWTLANFGEALSATTLEALKNSTLLGVAAACVVLVLAALLVAIRRHRGGRVLGTAVVLTFALPGSTLAVAVLLAYGGWLRDTLALILIAYVGKLWAVGHRTLAGSVDNLSADLTRAARMSGASRPTTVRTIVVPLVRPAIVAAVVLVGLTAFHELTMSSLLYGPGSETLAVVVLNAQQLGDATVTSALAVLLTGIVLVGAAPLLAVPRIRHAILSDGHGSGS